MEENVFPAIRYVRELQVKGSDYGLERTERLLRLCGSPDKKLKIIHVAGTNGKGSVCAYITNALISCGKTVGTFTSPMVYSYEEQFLVNGEKSAELTEKYLEKTIAASKGMGDKPTAFETETCAALSMFCGEGCEYAVVECGLGGLTDATNAISKKLVAVINSVSLEHTALLGNTLMEIAVQKAGIVKNCPFVANALQDGEVLRYFKDIGGIIAGVPEFINDTADGCTFTLNGEQYKIRMHGREQAYNAAVAVKVCEIVGLDRLAAKRGIENTFLAGRAEVINCGKTYILDGAHNPAGFSPLVGFAGKNFYGRFTIIYGCLSDKDTEGCLKLLSRLNGNIIAVTPQSYRAKPAEKVYDLCKKYFTEASVAESVADALEKADGDVVVVCGSFTILKEAKQWIGKKL